MDIRATESFGSDTITWHARDAEVAIKECAGSAEGLSGEEATQRLATHGENRLPPSHRLSPLVRFLIQ